MGLRFQNIHHNYGKVSVLKGLGIEVLQGEILCLIGPSGSGKSTLLRLAAGLEKLQQGEIALDDQIVANAKASVPAEQRPVGMMFQEFALFPHMSVAENIGFGIEHLSKAERQARIAELLSLVGLSGFEKRFPHTLSGGQQQRISLARALAPSPKVLLMDEPFAAVDSALRRQIREEIRQILKQTETSVIFVTHDPEEALSVADKVAVLGDGELLQEGTPQEIYEQPSHAEVAKMFGEAHEITGQYSSGTLETVYGKINLPSEQSQALQNGQQVRLIYRQGSISFEEKQDGACSVVESRFHPRGQLVTVKAGQAGEFLQLIGKQAQLKAGAKGALQIVGENLFVFPR